MISRTVQQCNLSKKYDVDWCGSRLIQSHSQHGGFPLFPPALTNTLTFIFGSFLHPLDVLYRLYRGFGKHQSSGRPRSACKMFPVQTHVPSSLGSVNICNICNICNCLAKFSCEIVSMHCVSTSTSHPPQLLAPQSFRTAQGCTSRRSWPWTCGGILWTEMAPPWIVNLTALIQS